MLATHLRDAYRVSERRACQVIRLHRATKRYKAKRDDQVVLRMRIREIAATRVRYGYQRIHVLLRREGWKVNHKRVYRLYREEGLPCATSARRGKSQPPTGNSFRLRWHRTSAGAWTSSLTRSSTVSDSGP